MIVFYYICIFSSSLPLIIQILIKKRKPINCFDRFFFSLILIRFLSDIFGVYFDLYFKNAYPVFHISVLLETVIYLQLLSINSTKLQRIFLHLMQIIVFLVSVYLLLNDGFWNSNWISSITSHFIILIFYFIFILKKSKYIHFDQSQFYTTVLFYTIVYIPYLLFSKIIRQNLDLFLFVWPVILSLILIFNLSFARISWLIRKN